ncbi:phytoene desaturase [Pantoea sp. Aalb]|uniref:phytoene desaturase n=1 Tax=Pantoea sp. Aalb TaxID=2576762 RepID=UPI001324868C|nr:phytoene desaturase [Pantoea sp. Aalb]MXP67988.1 phytoene desaturase [Pantoea sp. Aalb]
MRRIFIIGSGFGGLALAIRLQTAGIHTTVLEKQSKYGGCAYVWKEKGFTFDAGPTVITNPNAIKMLFTMSGRLFSDYIELLPVTPFYRLCWENGKRLDYSNNQLSLEQQIAQFNPKDVEGYRKFLNYSRNVFKIGYLQLSTVPFLKFKDMLRVFPQLSRLHAWRSVYSMVSHFIENEYLRQAFSFQSLFIGGNPFTTSSIYTLIHALELEWGVWFPRGGTGALVNAMVKLFKNLGGEILLNTEVSHLEIIGNRIHSIKIKDGRSFDVEAVASNADVIHTYHDLLRSHPIINKRVTSLKRKRMSNSLFILYFGLNKSHSHLSHHTVCFGPQYKKIINQIFNSNKISNEFSLYLHAPCNSDPSLAPSGCGSFYVLTPVPHLGTANINWQLEGPRLRDKIFIYLEKYYMPGLRQQLVTHKIFTPFDFRNTFHTYQGCAFSLAPILTQSAWFRPHNRDSNIQNLYLVGSGTHPGAGIPGVICSAQATAQLMLQDLLI